MVEEVTNHKDIRYTPGARYIVLDERQAIIERVIQKAIDGGWEWNKIWSDKDFILASFKESPRTYIFRHDFAKALWPGVHVGPAKTYEQLTPEWQYHLQQMVIADDPIKYLGEHLDKPEA